MISHFHAAGLPLMLCENPVGEKSKLIGVNDRHGLLDKPIQFIFPAAIAYVLRGLPTFRKKDLRAYYPP